MADYLKVGNVGLFETSPENCQPGSACKALFKELYDEMDSIQVPKAKINPKKMMLGEVLAYIPIFHYLLGQYNPIITRYIVFRGGSLPEKDEKTPCKYLEVVWHLLTTMFSYSPELSVHQFASGQFPSQMMDLLINAIKKVRIYSPKISTQVFEKRTRDQQILTTKSTAAERRMILTSVKQKLLEETRNQRVNGANTVDLIWSSVMMKECLRMFDPLSKRDVCYMPDCVPVIDVAQAKHQIDVKNGEGTRARKNVMHIIDMIDSDREFTQENDEIFEISPQVDRSKTGLDLRNVCESIRMSNSLIEISGAINEANCIKETVAKTEPQGEDCFFRVPLISEKDLNVSEVTVGNNKILQLADRIKNIEAIALSKEQKVCNNPVVSREDSTSTSVISERCPYLQNNSSENIRQAQNAYLCADTKEMPPSINKRNTSRSIVSPTAAVNSECNRRIMYEHLHLTPAVKNSQMQIPCTTEVNVGNLSISKINIEMQSPHGDRSPISPSSEGNQGRRNVHLTPDVKNGEVQIPRTTKDGNDNDREISPTRKRNVAYGNVRLTPNAKNSRQFPTTCTLEDSVQTLSKMINVPKKSPNGDFPIPCMIVVNEDSGSNTNNFSQNTPRVDSNVCSMNTPIEVDNHEENVWNVKNTITKSPHNVRSVSHILVTPEKVDNPSVNEDNNSRMEIPCSSIKNVTLRTKSPLNVRSVSPISENTERVQDIPCVKIAVGGNNSLMEISSSIEETVSCNKNITFRRTSTRGNRACPVSMSAKSTKGLPNVNEVAGVNNSQVKIPCSTAEYPSGIKNFSQKSPHNDRLVSPTSIRSERTQRLPSFNEVTVVNNCQMKISCATLQNPSITNNIIQKSPHNDRRVFPTSMKSERTQGLSNSNEVTGVNSSEIKVKRQFEDTEETVPNTKYIRKKSPEIDRRGHAISARSQRSSDLQNMNNTQSQIPFAVEDNEKHSSERKSSGEKTPHFVRRPNSMNTEKINGVQLTTGVNGNQVSCLSDDIVEIPPSDKKIVPKKSRTSRFSKNKGFKASSTMNTELNGCASSNGKKVRQVNGTENIPLQVSSIYADSEVSRSDEKTFGSYTSTFNLEVDFATTVNEETLDQQNIRDFGGKEYTPLKVPFEAPQSKFFNSTSIMNRSSMVESQMDFQSTGIHQATGVNSAFFAAACPRNEALPSRKMFFMNLPRAGRRSLTAYHNISEASGSNCSVSQATCTMEETKDTPLSSKGKVSKRASHSPTFVSPASNWKIDASPYSHLKTEQDLGNNTILNTAFTETPPRFHNKKPDLKNQESHFLSNPVKRTQDYFETSTPVIKRVNHLDQVLPVASDTFSPIRRNVSGAIFYGNGVGLMDGPLSPRG